MTAAPNNLIAVAGDMVHNARNRNEVITKLAAIAMTSPHQLPAPVRPNFATKALDWNLLSVSKNVHIAAHKAFYTMNTFFMLHADSVFSHRGKLVKTCEHQFCRASGPIKFVTGEINIGHENLQASAQLSINTVTTLFRSLPSAIHISNLSIQLHPHIFQSNAQIESFLDSLKNVRVTSRLTITGYDIHLQPWFRRMINVLDLKHEPIDFEMQMRDHTAAKFERFRADYVAATSEKDKLGEELTIHDILDPVMMYQTYIKMAETMDDKRYEIKTASNLPSVDI